MSILDDEDEIVKCAEIGVILDTMDKENDFECFGIFCEMCSAEKSVRAIKGNGFFVIEDKLTQKKDYYLVFEGKITPVDGNKLFLGHPNISEKALTTSMSAQTASSINNRIIKRINSRYVTTGRWRNDTYW